MNAELMQMLMKVSKEEQDILNGQSGIDKAIYTLDRDFTIDSKKMLKKGKLIDIRPHTRFVRFPRHRHNYIEIIYMCSGKTVHIIDGVHEVTLNAGNLLFLNQYTTHEILPTGFNDVAVNFVVLPEFFDVALSMIDSNSVIGSFLVSTLCHDANKGGYLHFKVADVVPVQNLVENLLWSIVNSQSNNNRINQTTMGLLLLTLMNYTDKLDRNDINQYDNRLIMLALKYIEENYKDASLTAFAQQVNQSVYRLSRLIKAGTGSTFKALLLQKRLSKTVTLLTETNLTVSDIILTVGYDNTSYFYRVFKEKYGQSPKEFRLGSRTA
jgi:AraC family transcriptional regulator, L-rhamnose operon regulatory protein RhaS